MSFNDEKLNAELMKPPQIEEKFEQVLVVSFAEYEELVNSCIEKFKLILEKQVDHPEMTTAEQVHAICA